MPDVDAAPQLTITEFSRLSGLSHKALRLYEISGLLEPAEVAPANRYRLYSSAQLERARRISLLRQLDMPLATVAHVLDGTDEDATYRMDLWWAHQEASLRAKRATVLYLRTRLAQGGESAPPQYPVRTRELPATKVATITRDVDQQALVATMKSCEEEIKEYLRGVGATVTDDSWTLYHGFVTPDSEAAVEICVPFEGTVDPAGEIAIRVEAAHTQAYCTVPRDDCFFPQILIAFENVRDWILRGRHTPVGPPREMYFAPWEAVAGPDPFVEVAQPFEAARPFETARQFPTARPLGEA